MSPTDFHINFQEHLELNLTEIEQIKSNYPPDDVILRLLLYSLRKKLPTYQNLWKVFCPDQSGTFDFEGVG